MLSVRETYDVRHAEIASYFQFLEIYDDLDLTGKSISKDDLFKTLKANGFLLLYNLVESTLKNALEAIFDELRRKSVTFDSCRLELRTQILKNLRKHNVEKIVRSMSVISTDVVVATFRKEEAAAGNVDAKVIREIAKLYGFAYPSLKSDELLTVKTSRNDLAHGLKSFSEVGRDFDLARLDGIRKEVCAFLRELIESVADYLNSAAYLIAK